MMNISMNGSSQRSNDNLLIWKFRIWFKTSRVKTTLRFPNWDLYKSIKYSIQLSNFGDSRKVLIKLASYNTTLRTNYILDILSFEGIYLY